MKGSPPAAVFGPDDLQRRFAEMMRQQMAGATSPGAAQPETQAEGSPTEEPKDDVLHFDYKPRDVKAYLDRFVIKQEEAKKVLSVALCDHYHHVRMAAEGNDNPNYAKQNILLMGPTGVGKTYLIRSMAELVGVPFVKADATKFSETGYVGGDVEDLVRDLVRIADGDIARAQRGIIYIDEIDKIAAVRELQGRDVSGRGVQTNLLKLMEETEVPARAANDIAGQVQAMMEWTQGRGKKQPSVINTRHILFVVSGAFGGLEKIIRKRLRESSIGFGAATHPIEEDDRCLEHARTSDFVEFGFEPEFIGRLPVRVVCLELKVEDLFQILQSSEGSIIRQYEQSFAAYGIEARFREEALRRIAELASEEKTGARGLMTVCERIFRDLKFELPSTPVTKVEATRELVDDPPAALKKLMAEAQSDEHHLLRREVDEFARGFGAAHGLKLRFLPEATERLVALALEEKVSVATVCGRKFKDFQFGLQLIARNTGQVEFPIDAAAVDHPDQALSDWVVKSYRK